MLVAEDKVVVVSGMHYGECGIINGVTKFMCSVELISRRQVVRVYQ
jgi:hypothetical protein